jgi:hypothetical protein
MFTVNVYSLIKFAVTVFAELIVMFEGFVVPLKLPLQLPNLYPPFALALQETTVPALYQLPETGDTLPPADGFAAVVN